MDIKAKRESMRLTQEEVALKLGVSRSTVAMWETGEVLPRAYLLPKLTKVLNCTLDDLYEKED